LNPFCSKTIFNDKVRSGSSSTIKTLLFIIIDLSPFTFCCQFMRLIVGRVKQKVAAFSL
jgi:hypothetical protein